MLGGIIPGTSPGGGGGAVAMPGAIMGGGGMPGGGGGPDAMVDCNLEFGMNESEGEERGERPGHESIYGLMTSVRRALRHVERLSIFLRDAKRFTFSNRHAPRDTIKSLPKNIRRVRRVP